MSTLLFLLNLLYNVDMYKSIIFPDNFLWGAGTSAYQVEGGNTNCDWHFWSKNDQNFSDLGCDHYHLYKEDFDLAKGLNHNIHRFSIEWSRIEPEKGKYNQKEINHYRQVLQALKDRGIKTMVTLHHFTNPLWLTWENGWTNEKSVEYFRKYTEVICKELGKYIDFWVTINEPIVYLASGYLSGDWPPGHAKSPRQAYLVFENMAQAHCQAYQVIHQHFPSAKVGIAKNNMYFESGHSWDLIAKTIVKIGDFFWNHWFLRKIRKYQDFIGLNYYFHFKIKSSALKKSFSLIANKDKRLSDLNWEIYPKGIYYLLKDLKKYNKPIYITENGLADRRDQLRPEFLIEHLIQVHRAIQKGIDIKGYIHWSLMDNLEWHQNYHPRFGLIEIDFETLRRIPRPSAYVYADIIKDNAITQSMIKKYAPKALE